MSPNHLLQIQACAAHKLHELGALGCGEVAFFDGSR